MNDKTKKPATEPDVEVKNEKPEVIKVDITLDHALTAGRALLEFKKEATMADAYISMAFILAYLQESMGLNPNQSMANLATAYQKIITSPDVCQQGFKEINKILLEKKIILPTRH